MCIAIYKDKGVKPLTLVDLKKCWDKNQDGAGLAIKIDGEWSIRKGFLKWSSFEAYFKNLRNNFELKDHELILHFRIATSGNVDAGACHPFPITRNIKALRAENFTTKNIMVHNGILWHASGKLSDSQEFVKNLLATKADLDSSYIDVLEHIVSGNRIFTEIDGDKIFFGDWKKHKGHKVSNLLPFPPKYTTKVKTLNKKAWVDGTWCDWCTNLASGEPVKVGGIEYNLCKSCKARFEANGSLNYI